MHNICSDTPGIFGQGCHFLDKGVMCWSDTVNLHIPAVGIEARGPMSYPGPTEGQLYT